MADKLISLDDLSRFKSKLWTSDYGMYLIDAIGTIGRNTTRDITSEVTSGLFKECINNTNSEFLENSIKEGDYFIGASGYKYTLAHYNYYYGGYDSYAIVSKYHYSLIVDTGLAHNWNDTDTTEDGYASSAINTYLVNTILPIVESDMSTFGLTVMEHYKLYTASINSSGCNRWGANTGCSNGWCWTNEKISLMTEMQVYGGTIWSSSGYDTGVERIQLKVFESFNPQAIVGQKWFWLRDVVSASAAALCGNHGYAYANPASGVFSVVPFISVY